VKDKSISEKLQVSFTVFCAFNVFSYHQHLRILKYMG